MADDPEEKQPAPRAQREIDIEEDVLNEAFEAGDERLQLEKTLLATAYLLDSCSGQGSESLDGAIAIGLAEILRGAARDAARLRRQLRRQHERAPADAQDE